MGERLQSQKSYVCTFFDCNAKFSKSWKLEAHLCKHTGLVSVGGIKRPGFCKCCRGSRVESLAVTAETVLLRELRQELLHPLPTHQTWAQPQRGKATQVSSSILLLWPKCWPLFCDLYRFCSSGVPLKVVQRPLSRTPAWRTTWLEFTTNGSDHTRYNTAALLLFCSVSAPKPRRVLLFQCDHLGCVMNFNKRNQLKAHQGEHRNVLPFQSVSPHLML